MYCAVYRMYEGSESLGEEAMRRAPTRGLLSYQDRLRHDEIRMTVFTARLGDEHGHYVLPPLDSAVVLRIDERGILIGGAEVHSRTGKRNSHTTHSRQAWLIQPEMARV